jgi:hypothetical protein
MLTTPFLGDKLNYILPGSMLLFSILFVVVSYTGYESKAVTHLRKNELGDKEIKSEVKTQLEKIY